MTPQPTMASEFLPPPPSEIAAADSLEQLQAESLTDVSLTVENGVVRSGFMAVPVSADEPVEAAFQFLEDYAPLFSLTSPREQLHPMRRRSDVGEHVRFVQRSLPERGGLPLFDSEIGVHIQDGLIYLVMGRYIPDLLAPAPTLPFLSVRETLELDPPLTNWRIDGDGRLGLLADWSGEGMPEAKPVWRLHVSGEVVSSGEPAFWRVDVDARSGEVVKVVDEVATDSDPNRSASDVDCDDKDFDIMYGYHDSSSSCWIFASTDDWFDEYGSLGSYDSATDHNSDGIEAFGYAHQVYDYYKNTLGQCSYDHDDAEVEMVTHAIVEGGASANGFCGTMNFSDDSVALDIVGHEFTHLVDYNEQNLVYEGLSGALDESFADVFACMMDGNWVIGEGATSIADRSLEDPPSTGHPDHILKEVSGDRVGLHPPDAAYDHGWVHTNSGIPNKAAYLIAMGGTHNGYKITGIGTFKTQWLYHLVHVSSIPSNASFDDARNALVGTAIHWGDSGHNGFTYFDACQVANAFASVGILEELADADCDRTSDGLDSDDDGDKTSDGRDNCRTMPNVSQSDTDGDGKGDICDTDIDNDAYLNSKDNCPYVPNDQMDSDGDAVGDVCDDDDWDSVLDIHDNCPGLSNWDQKNSDNDPDGDACDSDLDGDGWSNLDDNCPAIFNDTQEDIDTDQVGDLCDNCQYSSNPDQEDCDKNGIGGVCDENNVLEPIACHDWTIVEMDILLDPLEQVALPHVAIPDVNILPETYQLEVTVSGANAPWVITDHFGKVVALPMELRENTTFARWTPTLDYHYMEQKGRADFATSYRISSAPSEYSADVQIVVEGREASY